MSTRFPEPRTWYVCDKYGECESTPWPSPPYNPKQPKRCITHRQNMTTEIPSPDLAWPD